MMDTQTHYYGLVFRIIIIFILHIDFLVFLFNFHILNEAPRRILKLIYFQTVFHNFIILHLHVFIVNSLSESEFLIRFTVLTL